MGKLTFFCIFVLVLCSIYFMVEYTHIEEHDLTLRATPGKRYYTMQNDEAGKAPVAFDLLDPETAPESRLAKILYGYHLMLDTPERAPEYCHNKLTCENCHFMAGNSLGGTNRGIALVGVSAMYPRFSKRDNKNISLADRIENCFKRSMNGRALPHDSFEMESILAYLDWISTEVSDAPALPWLGLPKIATTHIPDAENGQEIYYRCCAICHGNHGEGTEGVPPLWGPDSYNDGAGMNTLPMLSSFVHLNMPYGQPILSPEESLDVAAYVIKQPRPHFVSDK